MESKNATTYFYVMMYAFLVSSVYTAATYMTVSSVLDNNTGASQTIAGCIYVAMTVAACCEFVVWSSDIHATSAREGCLVCAPQRLHGALYLPNSVALCQDGPSIKDRLKRTGSLGSKDPDPMALAQLRAWLQRLLAAQAPVEPPRTLDPTAISASATPSASSHGTNPSDDHSDGSQEIERASSGSYTSRTLRNYANQLESAFEELGAAIIDGVSGALSDTLFDSSAPSNNDSPIAPTVSSIDSEPTIVAAGEVSVQSNVESPRACSGELNVSIATAISVSKDSLSGASSVLGDTDAARGSILQPKRTGSCSDNSSCSVPSAKQCSVFCNGWEAALRGASEPSLTDLDIYGARQDIVPAPVEPEPADDGMDCCTDTGVHTPSAAATSAVEAVGQELSAPASAEDSNIDPSAVDDSCSVGSSSNFDSLESKDASADEADSDDGTVASGDDIEDDAASQPLTKPDEPLIDDAAAVQPVQEPAEPNILTNSGDELQAPGDEFDWDNASEPIFALHETDYLQCRRQASIGVEIEFSHAAVAPEPQCNSSTLGVSNSSSTIAEKAAPENAEVEELATPSGVQSSIYSKGWEAAAPPAVVKSWDAAPLKLKDPCGPSCDMVCEPTTTEAPQDDGCHLSGADRQTTPSSEQDTVFCNGWEATLSCNEATNGPLPDKEIYGAPEDVITAPTEPEPSDDGHDYCTDTAVFTPSAAEVTTAQNVEEEELINAPAAADEAISAAEDTSVFPVAEVKDTVRVGLPGRPHLRKFVCSDVASTSSVTEMYSNDIAKMHTRQALDDYYNRHVEECQYLPVPDKSEIAALTFGPDAAETYTSPAQEIKEKQAHRLYNANLQKFEDRPRLLKNDSSLKIRAVMTAVADETAPNTPPVADTELTPMEEIGILHADAPVMESKWQAGPARLQSVRVPGKGRGITMDGAPPADFVLQKIKEESDNGRYGLSGDSHPSGRRSIGAPRAAENTFTLDSSVWACHEDPFAGFVGPFQHFKASMGTYPVFQTPSAQHSGSCTQEAHGSYPADFLISIGADGEDMSADEAQCFDMRQLMAAVDV